jgi:hypothetical protein
MDQLVFAKSNALADAFTNLLAIHQGASYPEHGRIWSRRMLNGEDVFMQYSFREKATTVASDRSRDTIVRYLSVHFFQWDGYMVLYPHTPKEMAPYLPYWDNENKNGFAFEKFYREQAHRQHIYTLDEIENATGVGMDWLVNGKELQQKTGVALQVALDYITTFKKEHQSSAPLRLSLDALRSMITPQTNAP